MEKEMDLENQFSEKCQITTNDNCSQHSKTLLIKFSDGTQVLRGKCTSHHENGTYYIGTDLQSGDFYTVKEFVLPLLTDQEISELLNDIQASADLKNDNLAAIKNVKHENRDDKCIFYILQEYDFNAIYLSQLLNTNISLPINTFKEIIRKISILLKFLNSNNFSYIDFKSSAIYIKENGDLKFINYGKTARLFSSDFESCSDVELKVTKAQMHNLSLLLSSLLTAGSFSSGWDVVSDTTLRFKIQELLNLDSEEILENLSLRKFFHQSFDVSPNEECLENDPDKLGAISTLKRSQSRVEDDYEIQDLLGKGGFGQVHKVLKKCDGKTYALKKIVLKPNDKELNDKMIREVTFLSQLNHENIVRYYTSWTESEHNIEEIDSESSESIYDENSSSSEDKCTFEDDNFCDMNNCAEESSKRSRPKQSQNDSIKEDESIVFQRQTGSSIENDNLPTISTRREILYIQMEFCENKTLRSLIDSGVLMLSNFSVLWFSSFWAGRTKVSTEHCDHYILKYLRQIVEGLVYIHEENIIHRDLKPMNIFLSSNDHIKIGDFGLATKHIHYKSKNIESSQEQLENLTSKSDSGILTNQVGTGIYIAPELNTCARICDQKLDMYSLGIILFEMCYKQPVTVQEWNNIITKLRSSDVLFPEDFNISRFSKEKVIIELLLTHDVSKRPTSKELLKRDDLPPIVKSQDEEKQQELFKYVIDNPHLKLFKYLIDCCFKKENRNFNPVSYRNVKNFHVVNNNIVEIFKTHGAQNISRATLISTKCSKGDCRYCIKLMNHLGGFHYIPGNNNIPFINYVALNDSIKWIKCYSLDKKIRHLFTTDESYEYNFNIVTSIDFGKSFSFLPDAEILVIINKIKKSFSSQSDSFKILISHTLLLEAILIECNTPCITNDSQSPFCSNLDSFFTPFLLAASNIEILNKLPSKINSVESAKSILQHFKVPEAHCKANQALKELSYILQTARKLGLKNHDVIIAPKLFKSLTLYSGMIFKYINDTKREMLAEGGRYDRLIKHFQDSEDIPQKHTYKYGVGMTLNMEPLSKLCQSKEEIIVVCTFNKKGILPNEVKILRDLWNANFVCTYFKATSMKHLKFYCRNNSASYAIVLSNKNIKKNLTEIIDFKDNNLRTSECELGYRRLCGPHDLFLSVLKRCLVYYGMAIYNVRFIDEHRLATGLFEFLGVGVGSEQEIQIQKSILQRQLNQ